MTTIADKSTQHTPGPWTLMEPYGDHPWLMGADGRTVQWSSPDHPDSAAILSIHDLLAFVGKWANLMADAHHGQQFEREAKALIAKARGEAE